jgi:DNA-binding transcriptional MerR regulator
MSEAEEARGKPRAEDDPRGKPRKAPTAFRTISEVADDLHIPQHVLRFWETKFPQLKPMKRGGGRRYYRPEDVALVKRIGELLYEQGYTIKGVQRLLRDGTPEPRLGETGELPFPEPPAPPPAEERVRAAMEELAGIAAALRALAGR